MNEQMIKELKVKKLNNQVFANNNGASKVNGFVICHPQLGYISIGYKDSKGIELPFTGYSRVSMKELISSGKIETNKNFVWVQEGQYKL